jgi:23S rRNA pseudouridine1911/1915/1917 synthase
MIKHIKYREDGIVVNGARVTVRYVLKDKDVVSLALEDTESSETATPSDLEVDIIYEDDDLIIANKPPFMPTHPSHNHHHDTLANALANYFAKKDIPFVFRPINRLDRNTSGLVIVAKNRIAAAKLTDEMKSKRIKKTYVAYLEGALDDPEKTVEYMGMTLGVIDSCLHRTEKSIIVREVCSPDTHDAEEAITYYRILNRCDECTEVEIFPQTGRTHQLRVHFASVGHPIIGDDLYGSASPHIERHALHAKSLELSLLEKLGRETKHLILSAPMPADMINLRNTFFDKGN